MDIKFVELLKSFFPKGKAWEFQTNFNYLIDGISAEFGRMYDEATNFYNNFNIINSELLALQHGNDYLLTNGLYTELELQKIIVKYINKDLSFKEIIEDFANFINSPVIFAANGQPVQFGEFEFAETFGDENIPSNDFEVMSLVIILEEDIVCLEFRKINFLVEYLKPPYLRVTYINRPPYSENFIEFGRSTFPSEFGEVIEC